VIVEAVFNSFLFVALTEMGDKTQLLAFLLMCRYRKPWTIMGGIFVATVFNHLLAASVGRWLSDIVPADWMRWILAFVFFVFAVWVLIPDKEEKLESPRRWGPFVTTLVTFFLAEMGDKTQLSTVALAAKYESLLWVTMGTTAGMLFADGLVIFLGAKFTKKVSMKWLHRIAAVLCVAFGIGILLS
jgi:putative Ca2+/H+ antiporter (TMEM165/GDT1 family)